MNWESWVALNKMHFADGNLAEEFELCFAIWAARAKYKGRAIPVT